MLGTKVVRPLLLLLTSIILSCIGVGGGGFSAYRTIAPHLTTRTWAQTRAYVAGIHVHEIRRGGRRVSVRCDAVYTFVVNNYRYKGTQASVYHVNLFGTFQRKLCERLQAANRAGKSVCWYDVNDPSRSALEKIFVPEMMLYALLAMSLIGTAGLIYGTKAIRRLAQARSIGTCKRHSNERNWPVTWLVALCYWIVLAVVAIPISIDTSIQGVLLSLVNVAIGLVHICGAVFCVWRIRKSRNGGTLLVPNEMALRDVFTLRLPAALYSGEPRLVMTWNKENNFLLCNPVNKPKKINPIELRTNAVNETLEIDFVANAVPEHLSADSMCVLRISGDIGETQYMGTFLFGTAGEFRDIESRRRLGPSHMFSV